jgi:hypothetical protein
MNLKFLLGITIQVALIAALTWWLIHRLRTRVPDKVRMAEWEKKNGVIIVRAERRWILTGPFWMCRWPVVYRILVRDSAGAERMGWLCIEAPGCGIKMEVQWS